MPQTEHIYHLKDGPMNNSPDYEATMQGWWDDAEVGDPQDGDLIIEWYGDGYAIDTFTEEKRSELYSACTYRVLRRATPPEPEQPAWADALAVIVSRVQRREVFVREDDGTWTGPGASLDTHVLALYDPIPLYPAAPYDRQVQRAYLLGALVDIGYVDEGDMEEVPDAELDVLIDAVLDR